MSEAVVKDEQIFRDMPVKQAVLKMAVPTVIGQLIVLVYNLADTFFVGRTGNPYMVAGASLILPVFNISNALSGVIGMGGGTLISRLLGANRREEAGKVSAFTFYTAILIGLVWSVFILMFMNPLLNLLGASSNTFTYAYQYAFCVVVLGSVPTVLQLTCAQLLRATGFSGKAGFGVSMGGILNVILDPLFMFVLLPKGYEIVGAGIATLLSNVITMIYFMIQIHLSKNQSVLSLSIKDATGAEVNGLTITYGSNNTEVATVDATSGNVTIVDYGTATITATFAGNDTYVGTSASYTIVYTNPNQGSYTWDLTKKSYDGTPTDDLISWSCDFATMKNERNGSSNTAVNNFIPTSKSSTRMYKNNKLTITPQPGYIITSVVFTATTVDYATAFGGSTWTNAKAEYDKENSKVVIITPTNGTKEIKATIGGTCGFTGVTVYYERNTTPTITIDPSSLEVTSDEATGTFDVTYLNISDNSNANVFLCDADGSATEYDWILVDFDDDMNIKYVIEANTVTTPRTAYLKVNVGNYVSNLVAITQAAMVIDWVTLPYRYDSTGAMVDDEIGLTGENLDSYTSGSPAIKFVSKNNKISYLIMKMNEAPAILYFDIKGYGDGQNPWSGTFTVQTSADGETYTDLATYTDDDLSSTTETKFFTDFDTDVRYIKWIYTDKVLGNVALGNIIADNQAPSTATITISEYCYDYDTQMYYGTYSNESAFVVPEDLTVAEIKFDEDGLFEVDSYKPGAVVPANTGVMVSAEEPDDYEVTLVQGTYLSTVYVEDNCLRPTGNTGITAETMADADSDCTYYRLTMHNGAEIGFWWGAEDGAAFDLGPNKAYMAVKPGSESHPVKGFALNDFVDGIKAVETTETESNAIYNLAGQRISKMQKGIYIVNGKKVLVK